MLNIRDSAFEYLIPAGLVGIIFSFVLSNSRLSEEARLNALFDEAYYQIPGDCVTHDEYYLIGKVVNKFGYVSLGVESIIHNPNDVRELLVGREELPRVPETGDVLVLKVFLCSDEYGLPKKRFTYDVINGKGKDFSLFD